MGRLRLLFNASNSKKSSLILQSTRTRLHIQTALRQVTSVYTLFQFSRAPGSKAFVASPADARLHFDRMLYLPLYVLNIEGGTSLHGAETG
jgi:hypothetical protein